MELKSDEVSNYFHKQVLADGQCIRVIPLIFGYRLIISRNEQDQGYEDGW